MEGFGEEERMSLQIEELALNAWPSLQTIVHHGWLLRFAEGYTKRSNSVQAIYSGAIVILNSKLIIVKRFMSQPA